ncbi:mitochondrial substrate carrier family protein [Stylonychia lemnae]|uniref:Mitochondrial substrate carrier family protein n=1 Tax=Stylonychia lemnae TaxID=5949 RepID=A0A077ZXH8_STYLE|nr:mitochondrial substrate carrier family protein [Stylonychia lemnae]|eukprot:CDW73932.1 mitochondrial substrate carrier family protein [Stylonychia lemnae]
MSQNTTTSNTTSKQSLILKRAILGGAASIVAASSTHPIDVVKIRLQTQYQSQEKVYRNFFQSIRLIHSNEGITGLYKGLSASWVRESIYSTIRLGSYEPIKQLLGATDPNNTSFFLKFLSGGMAGMVASMFSTPMDLIKIRMQASDYTQQRRSILSHGKEIYQNWGLKGLWKGVQPTVFRAILLNATFLASYDHTKHTLINYKILPDGQVNHMVSSIISGICIALVITPIDLIKTRIQNQRVDNIKYKGILDQIARYYKKKTKPFHQLLVIGPQSAGKTTLIRAIIDNESIKILKKNDTENPSFKIKHVRYTLIEQTLQSLQSDLEKYLKVAAIILLIDISDENSINEGKEILNFIQENDVLKEKPIVIYGNKMDIASSITEYQIRKQFGLLIDMYTVQEQRVNIYLCSASINTGFMPGIQWLTDEFLKNPK